MSTTWFFTGTSTGLGRLWAQAALERGDRVVATARDVRKLDDLVARHGDAVLPLPLDVTDRDAAFAAVRAGAEHFGRLDVVVNNAGFGHFGMVEELTEAEIRSTMETNFFGALWVTQAALPILRAQGSGHVLQVTSEGGVRAYPGIGAYHASKWALEGLSESLHEELAPLGIHVTNIEPGPTSTGFAGAARSSVPNPDYDPVRAATDHEWHLADPAASTEAVLRVVDAPQPPRRVVIALENVHADLERIYDERLRTWREWRDLVPVGPAAAG